MHFPSQLRIGFAAAGIVALAGCADVSHSPSSPLGNANPTASHAALDSTNHERDVVPDTILAWDAKEKSYRAKPGEENAAFVFNVTNVSPAEVVIETTSTSCGCTVAELPADPWRIPPGGHGHIDVTMELNGQIGAVQKEVMVFTSKGTSLLKVEAVVPEP